MAWLVIYRDAPVVIHVGGAVCNLPTALIGIPCFHTLITSHIYPLTSTPSPFTHLHTLLPHPHHIPHLPTSTSTPSPFTHPTSTHLPPHPTFYFYIAGAISKTLCDEHAQQSHCLHIRKRHKQTIKHLGTYIYMYGPDDKVIWWVDIHIPSSILCFLTVSR